jgi:hypothetical protein
MEGKKPIYVGSGKTVSGQYGTFRNVTLKLSELKNYIYEYQGQKLVNLTINDKKETDQFGKNVSVTINDYKPENKEVVNKGDDLPF